MRKEPNKNAKVDGGVFCALGAGQKAKKDKALVGGRSAIQQLIWALKGGERGKDEIKSAGSKRTAMEDVSSRRSGRHLWETLK